MEYFILPNVLASLTVQHLVSFIGVLNIVQFLGLLRDSLIGVLVDEPSGFLYSAWTTLLGFHTLYFYFYKMGYLMIYMYIAKDIIKQFFIVLLFFRIQLSSCPVDLMYIPEIEMKYN